MATFHAGSKEQIDTGKYSPKQLEQLAKAGKTIQVYKQYLNLQFSKPLSDFPCFTYDVLANLYLTFRDQGILPFSGSYADQPNKIIEVFSVFRSLIQEQEEKQRKEQTKK